MAVLLLGSRSVICRRRGFCSLLGAGGSGAHGRSRSAIVSGDRRSRKTLLGWKPLRLARRCALLLMFINIQPPLSSTRTRLLAVSDVRTTDTELAS